MQFSEMGLAKRIVDDLATFGFSEPTEIQVKTIPAILAGRDIMASAETGSGKTAAYGLPIVQSLRAGSKPLPRVLILVPTRELAVQVEAEVVRFSNKCGIRTVTIYGGVGYDKQIRSFRKGVDVVVATPGRLFDHIERGDADLSNVQLLVLDEADRMLDMGFTPQVRRIVSEIKGPRQTVMFSATISKAVERSAEEFLKDPLTVFVNTERVEPASIEQHIHLVQEAEKDQLLIRLMNEQSEPRTVLVFTRTRHRAAKVCKRLNAANISAGEIHSDIPQNKRESTLKRFRNGEISVLVATDIAARGLDVPAISHVVNFDLPLSAADYVHRIGRTGRAGRSGIALSFVSKEQRYLIRDIEKVTGRTLSAASRISGSASSQDPSSLDANYVDSRTLDRGPHDRAVQDSDTHEFRPRAHAPRPRPFNNSARRDRPHAQSRSNDGSPAHVATSSDASFRPAASKRRRFRPLSDSQAPATADTSNRRFDKSKTKRAEGSFDRTEGPTGASGNRSTERHRNNPVQNGSNDFPGARSQSSSKKQKRRK